jgi:hypothetical protein
MGGSQVEHLATPSRLSMRINSRSDTHDSSFEIRWFPVENVHRLDTVVDHTKGPEEEPHEMTVLGKRSLIMG